MLRKLTILFAFAFFVLVLGWTVQPVHAHGPGVEGGCPHNRQNHPHCAQGGGNGGGGSKEKVAVCHSDCFGWDGFIMYVKNVDAHLAHGDTDYPPELDTTTESFAQIYLFNNDYCCDYPREINQCDNLKCCDPGKCPDPDNCPPKKGKGSN